MQSAAHHMGGACYLHATGMHKLTLDHAVLIPDLSRSVKATALHNMPFGNKFCCQTKLRSVVDSCLQYKVD